MQTRAEVMEMLRDQPVSTIRSILGELERVHGVDLSPDKEFDIVRGGPAYGGPPPPLRLYNEISEDQGDFDHHVYVTHPGKTIISVIKVIRNVLGVDLSEAKAMAEGRTVVKVFDSSRTIEATDLIKALRGAGATVEDRRRP